MDSKRQRLADAVRTHRTSSSHLCPLPFDLCPSIAIVGVSGYLPGCMSVAEFWQALDEDRPLIEEIPRQRFDWRDVYDPSGSDPAKSHTKWGGFIPDVETFDRELFRMSQAEAEQADPRLRLLLMSVYNTLEDAGYAPAALAQSATGVFVAVEDDEYQQTLCELGMAPVEPFTHAPSSIASRIAAFFDFRGASEIVNTMCSGVAVALHRAVLALRGGEIEQAVVGGANLMLRPDLFVALSRLQQLSPCATVKSFGDAAAGYLRAEGVGSVLLKPLPRAEADGDAIYATIRASAVGFNGAGGTSTAAPDVASHADLMLRCYTRAGIDPASLTYIEAQGMGSHVADIAEWDACNRALRRLAALRGVVLPPGHCRVSTLKPMIGHMHSASALGAVLKIIRSFETDRIHSIVGFDVPNRFLDLRDQPCRLATTTEPWPRTAAPRIAALHSYGAGGNNAHVVLEEYRGGVSPVAAAPACVLPLSAGTEALRARMAERLLAWIDREPRSLDAVAHTLQRGRDHMRYRVAFVANSVATLRQQLRAFCSGTEAAGVYYGDATRPDRHVVERQAAGGAERPGRQTAEQSAGEAGTRIAGLHRAALDWVGGGSKAFDSIASAALKGCLTEGPRPRAHLPVYPFDRQRYWALDRARAPEPAGRAIDHPVFRIQRFGDDSARCRVRLDVTDFFLADHRVNDRRILPAAAYLELARAAADAGAEVPTTTFTDVAWQRALFVDGPTAQLDVELVRGADGDVKFTFVAPAVARPTPIVERDSCGDRELGAGRSRIGRWELGVGSCCARPAPPPSSVDLASIARSCGSVVTADAIYARLARAGFGYGPLFRAVQECRFGDAHLLARVALPPGLPLDKDVVLHPSLLDAALQSALLLHLALSDDGGIAGAAPLPYSIDEIVVHAQLPREFVVHARRSSGPADRTLVFDGDICSYTGDVLVSLRGLYLRADRTDAARKTVQSGPQSMRARVALDERIWAESDVAPAAPDGTPEPKRIRFRLASDLEIPDSEVIPTETLQPDEALLKVCDALARRLRAGIASGSGSRFLFEVWCDRRLHSSACDGIVSFLKSIHGEHRHVQGRVIRLDADGPGRQPAPEALRAMCAAERADTRMIPEVAYRDGRRYVRNTTPVERLDDGRSTLLRTRGATYCVIGGGSLGAQLAQFLVERLGARVIVASRGGSAERGAAANGLGITRLPVDVTDRGAMERFVATLEGADVEGIFFTAGALHSGPAAGKSIVGMRDVIAPKASGALNLLGHCGRLSCRFIALFSSRASRGEPGNSDYAAANGFLDGLAEEFGPFEPARLVNRHGHIVSVISIGWPHWEAGGMQLAPELVELVRERDGLAPLPTGVGLELLQDIVRSSARHVAVSYREAAARQPASPARSSNAAPRQPASQFASGEAAAGRPASPGSSSEAAAALETALRQAISSCVGMPPSKVAMDAEFAALGLNSISVVNVCVALQKEHAIRVRPSAFFECGTARALQQHMLQALGAAPEGANTATIGADRATLHRQVVTQPSGSDAYEPIAIVGIDARFPGAAHADELWRNVVAGKRCITEWPGDRAPWRSTADTAVIRTAGSRWGAFLEGVDEFDPLFFSISPAEAALMDPQQRLLLQSVWSALEHAGVPPDVFAARTTGVFVAAAPSEYGRIVAIPDDHPLAATAVAASIAPARISHAFNFTGPSECCDTACSSALAALHRAVQALHLRECEQAIVASVNLLLRPETSRSFEAMEYLSADGVCRPFQQGANGFVRGEGVGTLVLKPLARAIEDEDTVHAVIRGSAVVHAGRGLSLTSPSAKGLSQAMVAAYRRGRVDPRTVPYIEAHGVSSPIGDAVEVSALAAAYRELSDAAPAAPAHVSYLSSLKPCIGHGEHVSGMAALVKAICALRHHVIPGLPGFTRLHEDVSLAGTPFEISAANRGWDTPAGAPRRASVNSFGFGGVNAHVVLEEFEQPVRETPRGPRHPEVIVMSARTRERLEELSRRTIAFLTTAESLSLDDFAYTLRTGRQPMPARLAFVAASREEAIHCLQRYLRGETAATEGRPEIYTGFVDAGATPTSAGEAEGASLDAADQTRIAREWALGRAVSWPRRHAHLRRIALPTYPFAREKHWLSEAPAPGEADTAEGTLESRLIAWLSRELQVPASRIREDDDLAEIGADSMVMLRLRRFCERWAGASIPVPELVSLGTVAAISARINTRQTSELESARDPLDLLREGLISIEEAAAAIAHEQG